MPIKRSLNKENSYEVSLKLDEKFSRGISYSSQIVFFEFLRYTCFSSAICPLHVPACNGLSCLHLVKLEKSKFENDLIWLESSAFDLILLCNLLAYCQSLKITKVTKVTFVQFTCLLSVTKDHVTRSVLSN